MIIVNKTETDLVGAIKGKPFSIPFNEVIFTKLQKLDKKLLQLGNTYDSENKKDVEALKSIYTEATELTTLNFGEVVASKSPYLSFNPVKEKFYLTMNKGKSTQVIDYRAIPQRLANLITESYEKDLDYMPVVKGWARFLKTEAEFTEERAEWFATFLTTMYTDNEAANEMHEIEGIDLFTAQQRCSYQDIALTQEGFLALYKVVEEVKKEWVIVTDKETGKVVLDDSGQPKKVQVYIDSYQNTYEIDAVSGEVTTTQGKPKYAEERMFTPAIHRHGENFYSGEKYGYIYKVGERQYIPKVHPKTNKPYSEDAASINFDNTFGGGGLYAGGLTYIEKYRHHGDAVLVCFADPANIISFQSEGHAMRLWELFPHNIMEDEVALKGLYHSSKYAKESIGRTEKRIAEVVKEKKEVIQEQLDDIDAQGTIDKELNKI